jgi:hypothetical protein
MQARDGACDDKLELNTWSVAEQIELSSISMQLVDSSSLWQPELRENGYGTPGLSSGWFRLKNGKSALLFRHDYSLKMLLLCSNSGYYVISHPGVENLYQNLLEKGVKQNGL